LARPSANNLKVRILSASALVPPALAAVWFGWPYLPALIAVAAAGMGVEWAKLASPGASRRALIARTLIVAVPVAAAVVAAFDAFAALEHALWIAALGSALVAAPMATRGYRATLWAACGTLYLSLAIVVFLWFAERAAGRESVLWLLAIVWGSDIGAYAAGRIFGGPRLAPRLSPNKTWAGFVGGVIVASMVGAAVAWAMGAASSFLLPAGLSLAAQAGDLAESVAKRHFAVKDSGNLIPGHGGLLDRLDSLLAAALILGALTALASPLPVLWGGLGQVL
jgi:phosphatidate cytidylyltransferase